jgi:hypothetical protein
LGPVVDVAFDPAEQVLYAMSAAGDLLARTPNGVVRVVPTHDLPITRSICFRPDPARLVVLTQTGNALVGIDPATGRRSAELPILGVASVDVVERGGGRGAYFAVSRAEHAFLRIDPETGEAFGVGPIDPAFDIVALAMDPASGVLTGLDTLEARLVRIDPDTGAVVETADLDAGEVIGIAVGPDGILLLLQRPERGGDTLIVPAVDVDDEGALALLASALGVEFTPYQEPERHRGSGAYATAVLLWPRGDARPEGLATWAIEVSDDYGEPGALGHLEFRVGGKVVWRGETPIDPETPFASGKVPEEVLASAKDGDTVIWGLVFDPKSGVKDVLANFRIVRNPEADDSLARVASSPVLARQVPLVRDLIAGQVLLKYGLDSEALVLHLSLVRTHPRSLLAARGVVTALGRLGLKDSRLWHPIVGSCAGGALATGPAGSTSFAAQTQPLLDEPTRRVLDLLVGSK